MIIGSIVGLVGSVVPSLMDGFFKGAQDKRDKKFENEIFDKQLLMQDKKTEALLNQSVIENNAKSLQTNYKESTKVILKSSQWVLNICALVRPFIVVFSFILLGYILVDIGLDDGDIMNAVKTLGINEMVAAIVTYYFGNRGVKSLRK